ncbi:ROK family protein [Sporosarcina limicola]|uniref:Glucokinase n=1 Tax=Sporosarcina limicola TaxID=34101 RepID=A0A927MIJ1_9BACL|nr:ROK family protein [Sporosarcina limicola]MBE1554548.1 glucokinase [Sporosarcina limicola]
MGYILAADIGGTKLATALFSKNGTVLQTLEIVSEKIDGEILFGSLIESFKSLCMGASVNSDDINGIAVGIPGIVDVEKGIAIFQNNLPWRDFPLTGRLVDAFPKSQIVVDNDVYMAAWGEYTTRGFSQESLVYLTLSTGISCCSIYKGQFLRGAGMAGEIGFCLMEASEASLESFVSGPALESRGRKECSNPELTLKEMMTFYYKGNERIGAIVNEAIIALAKEVYHILVYSDPHCIVLGGGVFNHHPELIEAVRKEVKLYLHHPLLQGKEKRIEASIYKGESGLHGAASRVCE